MARAQAPMQGGKLKLAETAYFFDGATVVAALVAGGGSCAFVWSCVVGLRRELKEDLKPLASLNITVALIQETLRTQQVTLKAVQETLKAVQETLKTQHETLKEQKAKTNVCLVLGLLGLLGTATVAYKSV